MKIQKHNEATIPYIIYYDDECPACAIYTKAFVSGGFLERTGRQRYSSISDDKNLGIDLDKARNEIALKNIQTGEVLYGVDSLFAIISRKIPILSPIFRNNLFRILILKLYLLISYNRKVIAPGKRFETEQSCYPDMHLGYRWLYIAIAWFITSFILTNYSSLLYPIIPESNLFREFLICGGQILFQGSIVYFVKPERTIHYLGNMMTISLIGAILLAPMLILGQYLESSFVFAGIFSLVVFYMTYIHFKKVKILGLPFWLTLTWLLYRGIILLVIL
jgi:hypothetical protein